MLCKRKHLLGRIGHATQHSIAAGHVDALHYGKRLVGPPVFWQMQAYTPKLPCKHKRDALGPAVESRTRPGQAL
jgi:hypothetical protein